MYILTLTTKNGLYSHKRIKEAAEARGHKMRLMNTADCWINLGDKVTISEESELLSQNNKKLAAIIPFIGNNMTFFGTSVLRHLNCSSVFCLNTSASILRTRDKLRAHQVLAKKGLPMPKTSIAHSPEKTGAIIDAVGGAPVVVKLVSDSTHGEGVVLAETRAAAVSVINAFNVLNTNILVQEFIEESSGRDLRCFVLGDKVVAAMERIAAEGEFRSNFHQGGRTVSAKISEEEEALAINAAKTLGLEMAGVDILRSNRGPLLLEVNAYPGFEGLELATGIDIANCIIEYIEQRVEALPMQAVE
ncbi:MAG: 30S ribosomal protein S6--L-glutamate ligase [Alphaproteobacteria bacterium]|nr:30S ribosomal protein S6--L-glutamate ligase [Alphaproteobacteria bacterium]MDD9919576.1 30S ribosomal protein S6--L-glutamate ligase [Alphaproteobacteria bacterium]